jgi:hypothetical protein
MRVSSFYSYKPTIFVVYIVYTLCQSNCANKKYLIDSELQVLIYLIADEFVLNCLCCIYCLESDISLYYIVYILFG